MGALRFALIGSYLVLAPACSSGSGGSKAGVDASAPEVDAGPPKPGSWNTLADCTWQPAVRDPDGEWLSMTSAGSQLWVVGKYGALRHDGNQWQQLSCMPSVTLSAAFASSESDVWLAGESLFHWNGTELQVDTAITESFQWFAGGWAFTPSDVYLGNTRGLWHWDGSVWLHPSESEVSGPIWGLESPRMYTVKRSGLTHAVFGWSGTEWSGVDIDGAHDIFGSGSMLYVSAWIDAGARLWSRNFDVPNTGFLEDPGVTALGLERADGVCASSPSDVWLVSRPSLAHWDGASWQARSAGIAGFLPTVCRARSPNDVWFAGEGGALVRWDGSSFTDFWAL